MTTGGINWHEMFVPTGSLLELVLRASLMYWFILAGFRVFRRDAGSLSVSDLLVVVLIADAAQNAMAADYKSVPDGVLLVAVIIFWSYALDWLGYRFQTDPHCDLAEQLTFYSVSGREGAARRFNLDFYCKAFGIESPKSHGVTGSNINELMAAGRYREIAEYCLRDVKATVQLYQIWRDRLSGIK